MVLFRTNNLYYNILLLLKRRLGIHCSRFKYPDGRTRRSHWKNHRVTAHMRTRNQDGRHTLTRSNYTIVTADVHPSSPYGVCTPYSAQTTPVKCTWTAVKPYNERIYLTNSAKNTQKPDRPIKAWRYKIVSLNGTNQPIVTNEMSTEAGKYLLSRNQLPQKLENQNGLKYFRFRLRV